MVVPSLAATRTNPLRRAQYRPWCSQPRFEVTTPTYHIASSPHQSIYCIETYVPGLGASGLGRQPPSLGAVKPLPHALEPLVRSQFIEERVHDLDG